ncbi:MAG: YabP/YqfC family sporulation protein [Firmicutes bacterium]|nr:YabP/YqfC family sporulation protein [Bacillota bacterium]
MHIKDTLVNFLYDKEYFISIYNNFIHVFNYKELISLTSKLVILKLDKFKLEIKGEDLFITKMMSNEILIRGVIKNVGINYE